MLKYGTKDSRWPLWWGPDNPALSLTLPSAHCTTALHRTPTASAASPAIQADADTAWERQDKDEVREYSGKHLVHCRPDSCSDHLTDFILATPPHCSQSSSHCRQKWPLQNIRCNPNALLLKRLRSLPTALRIKSITLTRPRASVLVLHQSHLLSVPPLQMLLTALQTLTHLPV